MKTVSLIAAGALAACNMGDRLANDGQCPDNERCSSVVMGLTFDGATPADTLFDSGPLPTAVGGVQNVLLSYDPSNTHTFVPLDLAYDAELVGTTGVEVVGADGATVTLRGIDAKSNLLRIVDANDGSLFDQKMVAGGSIATIDLVPGTFDFLPVDGPIAFASGAASIGVALRSASGDRLVDTSMTLDLAGSTRSAWDTLDVSHATAGTTSLTVTAGDQAAQSIDVVIVDSADALELTDALGAIDHLSVGAATAVCFAARASTRRVYGLRDWAFTTDNGTVTLVGGSCVSIQAASVGTVNIGVHGGGRDDTFAFTVVAQAKPATAARVAHPATTSEGDRLRMAE